MYFLGANFRQFKFHKPPNQTHKAAKKIYDFRLNHSLIAHMTKLKLLLGQWLANMTRKLKNNFYIYLAALFTVLVLLDAGVFGVGLNMRDRAFDLWWSTVWFSL